LAKSANVVNTRRVLSRLLAEYTETRPTCPSLLIDGLSVPKAMEQMDKTASRIKIFLAQLTL
jgi:hypothetical protein